MLAVVSLEGPVKVDVIEGSATDEECVNFFLEAQHYPEYPELGGEAVCDLLEEGWVLLFDRLGRSGRKKYPTAQHFNREVKGAFHENGIGLGHLPPKGSELDPEEHYNHWVQRFVYNYTPRARRDDVNEYGHVVPGPRTFAEAREAVNAAVAASKLKPTIFGGWYRNRSTGRALKKRWEINAVAQRVLRAREQQGQSKWVWDYNAVWDADFPSINDGDPNLLNPTAAAAERRAEHSAIVAEHARGRRNVGGGARAWRSAAATRREGVYELVDAANAAPAVPTMAASSVADEAPPQTLGQPQHARGSRPKAVGIRALRAATRRQAAEAAAATRVEMFGDHANVEWSELPPCWPSFTLENNDSDEEEGALGLVQLQRL
jgi:hypothetical protein